MDTCRKFGVCLPCSLIPFRSCNENESISPRSLSSATLPLPMNRTLLLGASLLCLAVLLMPSTAFAQSKSGESSLELSSETLNKTAEALLAVKEIRETYRKKMKEVYTQEKTRSLRIQMLLEIDRALVKVEGLSPERYETIIDAAQSDEDLMQKIQARAKKKKTGPQQASTK